MKTLNKVLRFALALIILLTNVGALAENAEQTVLEAMGQEVDALAEAIDAIRAEAEILEEDSDAAIHQWIEIAKIELTTIRMYMERFVSELTGEMEQKIEVAVIGINDDLAMIKEEAAALAENPDAKIHQAIADAMENAEKVRSYFVLNKLTVTEEIRDEAIAAIEDAQAEIEHLEAEAGDELQSAIDDIKDRLVIIKEYVSLEASEATEEIKLGAAKAITAMKSGIQSVRDQIASLDEEATGEIKDGLSQIEAGIQRIISVFRK